MSEYSSLVARVAARAAEDEPSPLNKDGLPAPLSAAALAEAEQRLGFALHPLLAALYTEIANGGFGPEYQLLSLSGGPSGEQAVDLYLSRRAQNAGTDWAWPDGVLPILTWGCGMYAAVDCKTPEGTVLLFEPNPGDPDTAWYVDSPSLPAWLEGYVEDSGWWVLAEEGEDYDEMPPWPHARERA